MVKYNCPKCNMEFYKKSNYNQHINKKFDCSPKNKSKCIDKNKNNILIQNNPINSKTNPINSKTNPNAQNINMPVQEHVFYSNLKKNIKNDIDEEINNSKINKSIQSNFCCGYCLKSYSTKSNLNKHLNTNCKIKKEKEEEKENIFKLLLSKDNEIKEQKEMINKILEQNQLLIKKIDVLAKSKISKSPNTKNINLTNTTNTTNNTSNTNTNTNISNSNNTTNTTNTQNNIVMFNFGKEDLNIIDKQIYIDRVVKKTITGVKIPEEILKIIHFNHQYPQLSNIYISDINREKCMIWEDGEWKLSPVDKIPEVIDKVVNYSNGVETELREKFVNNKKVNERLDIVNKYIKMNDSDYVEELRQEIEDEPDNKDVIKRCEGFQKLTYDTFKTTLYNEGKNIKKSMKN